jgi:hypothetical protein
MDIIIDVEQGPQTDTYRRLLDARQSLGYAEDGLYSLRHEPRTTEAAYDSAYASIACWTDRVRALQAQNDAEMEAWFAMVNQPNPEPETITIDGDTYTVVALNIDVPGDVTHRQTRRQAGESFGETVARLLAKALIEGVRLLARDDSPWFYVQSSTGPHKLYRINPETMHCPCEASGLCKHLVLLATHLEQVDRLSFLYDHRNQVA